MTKQIQIAILLFLSAAIITAQNKEAFSEFSVALSYNHNLSNGDLEEYWNKGKGLSFSTTTPFYLGDVGIGVDAAIFKSISEKQPDFQALFINLSWMQGIRLFKFSKLSIGAKFGSFNMLFDDTELSDFESNESELAVSASAKLEIDLFRGLALNLSSDLLTVFTRKHLKLVNAGTGLMYRFDSPKWIRDILE